MICYGISRACLSRAFQHSSDSLFRHHKPDIRATKEEVQYGGYWQQWACDWGNWQGGIDVLVHNALTPYVIKPFQDMTWEELGGKLDDEMRAAFAVTTAVLPAMTQQGWGRIIYLGTA